MALSFRTVKCDRCVMVNGFLELYRSIETFREVLTKKLMCSVQTERPWTSWRESHEQSFILSFFFILLISSPPNHLMCKRTLLKCVFLSLHWLLWNRKERIKEEIVLCDIWSREKVNWLTLNRNAFDSRLMMNTHNDTLAFKQHDHLYGMSRFSTSCSLS